MSKKNKSPLVFHVVKTYEIKSTQFKIFKRSFNIPFANIYLERIDFR